MLTPPFSLDPIYSPNQKSYSYSIGRKFFIEVHLGAKAGAI